MSRSTEPKGAKSQASGAPEAPPQEPYDAVVARLEQVVGALEGGGLTLEQSLERFAEGMALSREAQRKLDEAERRIEKLVRDADGGDSTVPLEAGKGG